MASAPEAADASRSAAAASPPADPDAAVDPDRPRDRPTGSGSFLGRLIKRLTRTDDADFILQIVQPSLVGLIDGTVSTLAPIFAAAVSTSSHTALVVGVATALGAGVSMGMSEALSDTGEQTGRGPALARGFITGGATALGGIFHSLPFLIADVGKALAVAGIVVAIELFAIAWVRHRFLNVSMRSSLVVVTLGGAIVLAIGVVVGSS
jgi:erythrin-vacuolar iron transport family protein